VVPSAFTLHTGRRHWHHLLSARAVDQFAWVLAANQTGVHGDGRQTFGHTAIVNPDGKVLGELPEGEGFICEAIDPGAGKRTRKNIPLHQHRRTDLFSV
jgi:predicted amidohydrolase